MTSDVNQDCMVGRVSYCKEETQEDACLLLNESMIYIIDSGYYVDYQVNKGKVFV
ncbi:hypothetical protein [Neisseria lactamica]|uniref:hypothetical protein n=1 Tax=Neisseria lactamica TaxID=486 RepID=UPI0013791617|nr:hypothetical protein [Neisseria lactamica]